jgi:hypothetical protein
LVGYYRLLDFSSPHGGATVVLPCQPAWNSPLGCVGHLLVMKTNTAWTLWLPDA